MTPCLALLFALAVTFSAADEGQYGGGNNGGSGGNGGHSGTYEYVVDFLTTTPDSVDAIVCKFHENR